MILLFDMSIFISSLIFYKFTKYTMDINSQVDYSLVQQSRTAIQIQNLKNVI